MSDAIVEIVKLLKSNWNISLSLALKTSVFLITVKGKRVRMQDKDVVRVFETAHNEAQPELLFDFVNEHINLTIDVRTVKSRERLSKIRDEIRRILHLHRKGDGINFDRVIFKTRTDLSDRSKRMFRYTMQAEVITFSKPLVAV